MCNYPRRALGFWLTTLALPPAFAALACSLIKSIGIRFDRNWTAMLRARYPNREVVFISTQADFGEHNASSLGLRRARNVARTLEQDLQFVVPKVTLPSEGMLLPFRHPTAASWSGASMLNFCLRAPISARGR